MTAQRHQNRMEQHFQGQGQLDSSLLDRCCQATGDSIRENPLLATFAAFGLGLGLGAVVGGSLAEPMGMRHRHTAESLGQRVLDSITDALPNRVRQNIHL